MPSKTFFNLSPEKQANILSAAKKEFARVPFEQTSFMKLQKMQVFHAVIYTIILPINKSCFLIYWKTLSQVFSL